MKGFRRDASDSETLTRGPYHAKMAPHCGNKVIRKLIDLYPPKFLVAGHVHHFQKERMGLTLAVTLPPALIEPIIIIKDKEIVQL